MTSWKDMLVPLIEIGVGTESQEVKSKACRALNEPLAGALALLREGRHEAAAAAIRGLQISPPIAADVGTHDVGTQLQAMLLRAYAELRGGRREQGIETLRRGMDLGRSQGVLDCVLCQAPDVLARLCAEALEAGIEVDYAQRLIRHAHLRAPSPRWTRWPYPVRIHVLGRPALVVRGQAVQFTGKAQKRPLEILHYLVSCGGRQVPVSRVLHALWDRPEDGDARGAFDMGLSRLRHLLTMPDALLLSAGRLSLNEHLCWADILAWERLLGEAEAEADAACRLALLERALDMYQGGFLPGEEAGWAVLAQERFRSRLLRAIQRNGQSLEDSGNRAEAARLYERAREAFPMDEELCRRLLRNHIDRGEFSQAKSLYGRCREMFARVLGVLPSPATLALFKRLPDRRSE